MEPATARQNILKEGMDINVLGLNQALVDSYGDILHRQYVVGDPIPEQISFSATSSSPYTGNAYRYAWNKRQTSSHRKIEENFPH